MSKAKTMGVQSDHESGYFEGDDVGDDDDLEIIHEEIVNPGNLPIKRGLFCCLFIFIFRLSSTKVGETAKCIGNVWTRYPVARILV
jgi:hypothetical protein